MASGRKTIEVRTWPTTVRDRILIHAAKIPDDRPEAWAWVTDELRPLAELAGGLIGAAELLSCIRYRTPTGFSHDAARHLNDPSWFASPHMYGFTFRGATTVPFVPCKGNVRFFKVDMPEAE